MKNRLTVITTLLLMTVGLFSRYFREPDYRFRPIQG